MFSNRKQLLRRIVLFTLMFSLLVMPSQTALAKVGSAYTTYTYDEYGSAVSSPHAFEFAREYTGSDLGTGVFSDAMDIFVDGNNHIYIVDNGNNRLVILDEKFQLIKEFQKFWNPEKDYAPIDGVDEFRSPSSVFVTKEGRIFVADTDNARIVEFDQEFHYIREYLAPESMILGEGYIYKPVSIVIDSANRMYVMSKNDNEGILELSPTGEFIGYYGAQSVKRNILDWFKTLFMTKEQKSRIAKIIPRTYNSMAIDSKDFIWLTSNSLESWERYNYLNSKASENAVVKRLNPNGSDVLVRNGLWAPGGDINDPPSSIVDVAIKPNGIYTLLDNSYNKLFTYDTNGNLLYAFGGVGTQDGVMTLASALTYFGDDILVLDKEDDVLVYYQRTEYGTLLENAILADIDRDFDLSLECWSKVLNMNQNLDLAYKATGDNYLRSGKYESAMESFKYAGNKEGFSKAYRYSRTNFVKENFLPVIMVPVIVLSLWLLFTRWVKKENKKLYAVGSKHTIKDELLYAFRVIYHPFDGFWEIKREKRGSVRATTIIVIAVLFTMFYKSMGTAYLFREIDIQYVDILQDFLNVLIPLALWCFASWGLTTLMGGEGSLKDIYIMTAYSMMPIILMNIPVTIASNFLVLEEKEFLSFFVTLGYIWMISLIFFGSMIIHDYHFNKNFGTVILSIVGMGVMLFLALLFVTLGQKIIQFLVLIYEEIVFRL